MNHKSIKIGEPIPVKRPQSYELNVLEHVKPLDPSEYGATGSKIDPLEYFITSGDAVSKAKALLKDFKAILPKAKGKYVTATKASIKATEELIRKLEEARGEACFLETEWESHTLYVIPKNPRDKTPAP